MVVEVSPKDESVRVEGINLHYLDWGNHDKPAMLLVHGMTGNCRDWDGFARELQADYHIIALDQPGHGDSDWSKDGAYRTRHYLATIEGFVDKLALGRFLYIGHSMGAHNGIAYAARHSDRVEKLALVDFGPAREFPSQSWAPPPADFGSLEEVFQWLKQGRDTTPKETLREKARWRTKQLPNGRYAFKHDVVVSESWDCEDLWAELPKVVCPTLMMRGGESTSITTEFSKKVALTLPKGQFVEIPGAGHSIMLDKPAEFTAAVRSFLAS